MGDVRTHREEQQMASHHSSHEHEHDDRHDRGLEFDLSTLLHRRRALALLGGAGLAALAACTTSSNRSGSSSSTTAATGSLGATTDVDVVPAETAGPYPGDGSNGPNALSQSGIVRSDIRSSFGSSSGTAEGVPMTLTLALKDLANGGVPFAGVAVYVWHCTREGGYSLYSDGVTDQNFLRGVQVAGDDGTVTFTSIVPACYSGRWPHIHFEVYPDQASTADATKAVATSQVALPKDLCDAVYATSGYEASVANLAQVSLAADNVFGEDSGAHQLATVSGSVARGYAVSLTVGVDTTTEPTGGSAGGGSPGGGQPPSGGPPAGGSR